MKLEVIKHINRLKTSFKNLSIFYKLILCLGFLSIFLILTTYINFLYYKNDKYLSTIDTLEKMNSQCLSEIDSYITDIVSLSEIPLFYKNPDIVTMLKESNSNSDIFLQYDNQLNYMFNNIFSLKSNIHSVFLFNLKGKTAYKISGGSLLQNYYPDNEDWFKAAINNFGSPVITSSYEVKNIGDKPNGLNYIFTVSRSLVDYDSGTVVGVIAINSSVDIVKNLLDKLFLYNNQRIVLVDSTDTIMYDSKEENISKKLSNTDLSKALLDSKDNNLTLNGVKSLYAINKTTDNGLRIINIVPETSISNEINNFKNTTMFFSLFVIALALLAVVAIIQRLVHPLQVLTSKMKLVEKGDFNISLNIDSKDEVGKLAESFKTMTVKLNELINDAYVEKINQKELEIKMLQNQINPHFLYNTLESIHMMAEINDDFAVSEMAISLGSILRYGLSTNINIVSLNDEINNIKLYMDLQKNRLDNIDDIYINITDELLDVKVIKLILQPIVENAIYHGLSTIATGGAISVTAYSENDNLIIDVYDNGNGIDSTTLYKLNSYINGFNNAFNSIGLKNVNMRLKLHYGNKYGLKIISNVNEGTLVKVILPLVK